MHANLEFCERYNYPPEVKKHFKMILDPISSDKILSVLLIGGTSRGELSYRRVDNELIIFSDYEFLMIAKGRVKKSYKRKLQHYYDNLQKQIGARSPLFHIDFDYISLRKLANLKRTFWTYEVKEKGITIWGQDLKDRIPNVTLKNIDLKELNEALIWRLWTIFLYTPPELLTKKDISSKKEMVFKYVLSKNTLDITTWLLPWEGYLIPSFTRRVAFIKEKYQELGCNFFFGENFPDFLELCLEGKIKLRFNAGTVEELYRQSIAYFVNALEYLIYRSLSLRVSSEEIPAIIIEKSDKLFRDNALRRRAYDAILGLKRAPNLKGKLLSWYLTKKHGVILVILLNLHNATLQFIKGNERKAKRLINEAKKWLSKISFLPLSNSDDFLNEYLAVRKNLVYYMTQYFPWIKNQQAHVRSIEKNFYSDWGS